MTRWQMLGLAFTAPFIVIAVGFAAGLAWAAVQTVHARWGGSGLAVGSAFLLAVIGVALLLGGW